MLKNRSNKWVLAGLLILLIMIFIYYIFSHTDVPPSPSVEDTALSSDSLPQLDANPATPDVPSPAPFQLHVLSVGKADSLLLTSPDGHAMLVDCGDDLDADYIYSYLVSHGVTALDYLVLTHPHDDHIGSADMVLNNFSVGSLVIARTDTPQVYVDAMTAAADLGVPVMQVAPEMTWSLGEAQVQVLGPLDLDAANVNDRSLVLKVAYGATSFLLMGDANFEAESALMARYGGALDCDMLKVAHHGYNSSTSAEFLSLTTPAAAVISVPTPEEMPGGPPSSAVVERLAAAGSGVYRTGSDGTVVVSTDGNALEVEPAVDQIELRTPPVADRNVVVDWIEENRD